MVIYYTDVMKVLRIRTGTAIAEETYSIEESENVIRRGVRKENLRQLEEYHHVQPRVSGRKL